MTDGGGAGNDGMGRAGSRSPQLITSPLQNKVGAHALPAYAGMTVKKKGNDERGEGPGMTDRAGGARF